MDDLDDEEGGDIEEIARGSDLPLADPGQLRHLSHHRPLLTSDQGQLHLAQFLVFLNATLGHLG